jgi:hypothetical protein
MFILNYGCLIYCIRDTSESGFDENRLAYDLVLATSIIWVALIGVMPAVKKTSASTIVFVVLYIDS